MPKVSPEKITQALNLMTIHNIGQHEISRVTGLSRPFIKKLADSVGYKFPRNGIEVLGKLWMCTECGELFRRSASKIERTKNAFCSEYCYNAWSRGSNHKDWKGGKTVNTFSNWVRSQASYEDWRQKVLANCDNKCIISGRTYDLDIHHITPKAIRPDMALDPENGIVLNREIHREIHKLIHEGIGFEEAIVVLKEKYKEDEK